MGVREDLTAEAEVKELRETLDYVARYAASEAPDRIEKILKACLVALAVPPVPRVRVEARRAEVTAQDQATRKMVQALPERVVVDANGAYWRSFDSEGFYSMCPVSSDNDPVEEIAVYERVPAWRTMYTLAEVVDMGWLTPGRVSALKQLVAPLAPWPPEREFVSRLLDPSVPLAASGVGGKEGEE